MKTINRFLLLLLLPLACLAQPVSNVFSNIQVTNNGDFHTISLDQTPVLSYGSGAVSASGTLKATHLIGLTDTYSLLGEFSSITANGLLSTNWTASRLLMSDGSKNAVSVSTTGLIDGTGSAATFAEWTNAAGIFTAATAKFLREDGTMQTPGGGGNVTTTSLTTGKLTKGSGATSIADGDFAAWTNTANIFTAGTAKFLREDGTMQTPGGGGNVTAGTLTSGIYPVASGATAIQDGKLYASSVTNLQSGGVFSAYGLGPITNLTASLPVQTDASKNLISLAVDLSGSQASGTLAAARFGTLSGDVTTAGGSYSTTVAKINGATLGTTTATAKNILIAENSVWQSTALSGPVSIATNGTTSVKTTKYLYIGQGWNRLSGTGCVLVNTNDVTAVHFMVPQFSGDATTGVTNQNFVRFVLAVPADIDTSVDLTATLKFELGGADTAAHTYHIGMVSVADSAAADATAATYVTLSFAGDASGASGDIETIGPTTLTGWKSAVTAGQYWVIQLDRLGSDTSTVNSWLRELVIAYGSTQ